MIADCINVVSCFHTSAKMGRPTDKELRDLLPPSLLQRAAAAKVPLSRPKVTFDETFSDFDGEPFWETLISLSKFGNDVASTIDFISSAVLPLPEDRNFPTLALGLSVILDSAPGALLKGVNSRWGSYFRIFSVKLMHQFIDLPDHLVPWSRARWEDELGFSTEQWLWAVDVFLTPCVHSEVLELHDYSTHHFGDAAKVIRDLYPEIVDPYEKRLEGEFGKSIYTFAEEVQRGIPTLESLGRTPTFADAIYWYKMIDHVHRPVIAHFGRYPYRNLAMGRESTPEEIKFQEDNHHFAEIDGESARQIRSDVLQGVWRPLQE